MELPATTDKYTSQRSGLRQRRKTDVACLKEPSVVEEWCMEGSLELWQVKSFDAKLVLLSLLLLPLLLFLFSLLLLRVILLPRWL